MQFRGNSFIRIGSYKKTLKDHPERERKIWNKTQRRAFEREFAMKGVTSDKVLQLIDYPSYFDLVAAPLPPNKESILEKLEQDKIIKKRNNNYDITNLGAILFAKNINEFEAIERKAVCVIIYEGRNRLKTVREQIGKRGGVE